jgi:hypothetical protein
VEPPKRKRLKPGELVALSLTLDQVDIITEHTYVDENLLAILYAAKVYDNVVLVRCTLEDLDQLSKHVANEAKMTKDKKLQQKLYAIFQEIRALEQFYYGVPLRIIASNPSVKRKELKIKWALYRHTDKELQRWENLHDEQTIMASARKTVDTGNFRMSLNEAKSIIEALANGVDPETGEVLSAQSVFNNPQVIRALFIATNALDGLAKREKQAKTLPGNAGNAWSRTEDSELLNAFDAGGSIKDISAKHGRTEGAIASRLIRLGRIKKWTTA